MRLLKSTILSLIIIIIIINGISNAQNHRNVPCSMRYINYYNLKSLNIHIKINNG